MSVPDYVAHYDVKAGDTLSHVAARRLGDVGLTVQLAALNRLDPPYALRPGQRLIVPDFARSDRTLAYMHGELVGNATGGPARAIADILTKSAEFSAEARRYFEDAADDRWYQFIQSGIKVRVGSDMQTAAATQRTEALVRWAFLVRGPTAVTAAGPWDHKPILAEMYRQMSDPPGSYGRGNPPRALHFPIRGDVSREYFYDVWSNIHYGFVGTRIGFDRRTLLDGAAAGLPGVGRTDAGDVISVDIGIDLWRAAGAGLTADQLRRAVLAKAPAYEAAGRTDGTAVVISGNDYK